MHTQCHTWGRREGNRVASNTHRGKRVLTEWYLKLTLKQFLALPKPTNYMAAPHTGSIKEVAHLSSNTLGTAVSIVFTILIQHIHL